MLYRIADGPKVKIVKGLFTGQLGRIRNQSPTFASIDIPGAILNVPADHYAILPLN